jgi:hypothetical protein
MHNLGTQLATTLGVLCLGLVLTASPIGAAPGGNANGNAGGTGHGQNGNGNAFGHRDAGSAPSPGETPELSSLLLFGTGTAGAASYALMRIRAGRRRDEDPTPPASDC